MDIDGIGLYYITGSCQACVFNLNACCFKEILRNEFTNIIAVEYSDGKR